MRFNASISMYFFYLGETSQFFVSKSPNDPNIRKGAFSVGISGPATVFLDANETEHGYEVSFVSSLTKTKDSTKKEIIHKV